MYAAHCAVVCGRQNSGRKSGGAKVFYELVEFLILRILRRPLPMMVMGAMRVAGRRGQADPRQHDGQQKRGAQDRPYKE